MKMLPPGDGYERSLSPADGANMILGHRARRSVRIGVQKEIVYNRSRLAVFLPPRVPIRQYLKSKMEVVKFND